MYFMKVHFFVECKMLAQGRSCNCLNRTLPLYPKNPSGKGEFKLTKRGLLEKFWSHLHLLLHKVASKFAVSKFAVIF